MPVIALFRMPYNLLTSLIPVIQIHIAIYRTSIDGSIFFLYYLYCLSIFQRTCCFRFKSGCKGKGFIFNYQTFSEVFFYFSFFSFLVASLVEREAKRKRKKNQAPFLLKECQLALLSFSKAGAKLHVLSDTTKFFS